jgi:hypothetical protein
MNLEQEIAGTNPPAACAEVLRQFHEANQGKPDDFANAMVEMICKGEVVVYLDQDRMLTIKAPHLTN